MVEYRVMTDKYGHAVYRRVDTEDGAKYQIWSPPNNDWIESEEAFGAFIGFEPSTPITEEGAIEIIEGSSSQKV